MLDLSVRQNRTKVPNAVLIGAQLGQRRQIRVGHGRLDALEAQHGLLQDKEQLADTLTVDGLSDGGHLGERAHGAQDHLLREILAGDAAEVRHLFVVESGGELEDHQVRHGVCVEQLAQQVQRVQGVARPQRDVDVFHVECALVQRFLLAVDLVDHGLHVAFFDACRVKMVLSNYFIIDLMGLDLI